ncbi:outer membrane protein H.8 precursor, partial [Ralstonia solanacearum]
MNRSLLLAALAAIALAGCGRSDESGKAGTAPAP